MEILEKSYRDLEDPRKVNHVRLFHDLHPKHYGKQAFDTPEAEQVWQLAEELRQKIRRRCDYLTPGWCSILRPSYTTTYTIVTVILASTIIITTATTTISTTTTDFSPSHRIPLNTAYSLHNHPSQTTGELRRPYKHFARNRKATGKLTGKGPTLGHVSQGDKGQPHTNSTSTNIALYLILTKLLFT